jgi:hypothetical protein
VEAGAGVIEAGEADRGGEAVHHEKWRGWQGMC